MLDITLVCLIIAVALVLFASEKLRVDLVALLIMASLMVIGVFRPNFVTAQEGISGFSNTATVTIAAMFVLSSGLVRTGAVNLISQKLIQFGSGSETGLFVLLMTTVGIVSAFINNTAAVAIFLPITVTICRRHQISPSRFLIPLSFISIVGGTCTLIGTSTNILVSSLAADHGVREFGMFELTKLGILFFGTGMLYLTFVGKRMLKDRAGSTTLTGKYHIGRYLTRVVVDKKSSLVLRTPAESRLNEKYDVTILEIIRGDERMWSGIRNVKLHEQDHLLVRGSIHNIMEMNAMEGLRIIPQEKYADQELTAGEAVLVEGIIAPSSPLIGRSLQEADFRHQHGVFALAIQKHGETIRDQVSKIKLAAGDTLLLQGTRDFMASLAKSPHFLMLQELELSPVRREKAIHAISIIGMVVVLAAFKVLPILLAGLVGCILMILTGCLKVQEAYDSIDWFVIFLLAGIIPLGIAMEKTGTAQFVATGILQLTESLGPAAVISVFYLVATIFSSVMSHNAAAILLVPIGIASAQELGFNPLPFLMAITFAASSSLSTPFGYHTNLMVYGPGGYTFSDFLKVGVPLNILLWIIASIFIPIFWPFELVAASVPAF